MRFRPVRGSAAMPASFALAALLFAAGCTGDAAKKLAADSGTNTQSDKVQGTDIDCPSISVRSGAGTWQTPTGEASTTLRYQASLGQMARECAILGETMTIKVGIEGRVLVGPKGTPGNVAIPLRMALVAEGPQPKAIWTKFYSVPVTIPQGQSGAAFTQVEDDLSFALPPSKDISNYVIYVGFDPQGAARSKKSSPPVAHSTAPKKKRAVAPQTTAPAASGGFAPPSGGGFAPPSNGGFAPPAQQQ